MKIKRLTSAPFVVAQIEPPRCKQSFNHDEFLASFIDDEGTWSDYASEDKSDGHRVLLHMSPEGLGKKNYLTTRVLSKRTGLLGEKQESMPTIRDFRFNSEWRGWVLDGELVTPDGKGTSSDAHSAISKGQAVLTVWDLFHPSEEGRAVHYIHRRKTLKDFLKYHPDIPWLKLLPSRRDHENHLNEVMAAGGEGIILKPLNSAYGEGWVKVKGCITEDCAIIGFVMSTEGKYHQQGWIKSVELAQLFPIDKVAKLKNPFRVSNELAAKLPVRPGHVWVSVGRASGMDEEMRASLTKNRNSLIGQMAVEIECQLRLASGSFRHPRFVRLRADKPLKDCVIAK